MFDSSTAGTPVSLHPPDSPEITQIISPQPSQTSPHREAVSPIILSQGSNTVLLQSTGISKPAETPQASNIPLTNSQTTAASQLRSVSRIANQLLSKAQDIQPVVPKRKAVSDLPNVISIPTIDLRPPSSTQSLVMLQINKSGGAVLVPANQIVTAKAASVSPVKLASTTLSAAAAAVQAQQHINKPVALAPQPTAAVDPNLVSNTVIPVNAAGGDNSAASLLQAKLVR